MCGGITAIHQHRGVTFGRGKTLSQLTLLTQRKTTWKEGIAELNWKRVVGWHLIFQLPQDPQAHKAHAPHAHSSLNTLTSVEESKSPSDPSCAGGTAAE